MKANTLVLSAVIESALFPLALMFLALMWSDRWRGTMYGDVTGVAGVVTAYLAIGVLAAFMGSALLLFRRGQMNAKNGLIMLVAGLASAGFTTAFFH